MRRKLIPALVVALLGMFPVASAFAAPPETPVSFDGAGFGHGVGMSQYGAYGRALAGQLHQEILVGPSGYYQGASLKTMGDNIVNPGTVFTNVASDITSTTITAMGFEPSVSLKDGIEATVADFQKRANDGEFSVGKV